MIFTEKGLEKGLVPSQTSPGSPGWVLAEGCTTRPPLMRVPWNFVGKSKRDELLFSHLWTTWSYTNAK